MVVDNVNQFSPWIDLNDLKLPTSTVVFDEEGKVYFYTGIFPNHLMH